MKEKTINSILPMCNRNIQIGISFLPALKIKAIFVLVFSLFTGIVINAQTVSGTIVDTEGSPLIGASILEVGTTNGTITDVDGSYSLTVNDVSGSLMISYVGYQNIEIDMAGRTVLDFTMQNTALLDEVIVVGYGTVKKSDLTGAVASLRSDDLNPGANVSVDQMLQGRVAGVQVSQSSSEPGGGLSIRVRGASSINAGNEPLYVIDGFPIDNASNLSGSGPASTATNNSPRNPLNSINPSDIESIEILKDASATAIYGSRGANGVILITTKKGTSEKMQVSYDAYYGTQKIAKEIDVMNTAQYIDFINGVSQDQGNGEVFSGGDISSIGAGTVWNDQVYRSAPVTDHTLSMSGRANKTSIYASANYFNQQGIVKNSGIQKFIARLNAESEVSDKMTVGLNLNSSLVMDNNGIDGLQTNENAGPIYTSLLYDPTEPILNADGGFSRSANLTINNPASLIAGVNSDTETNRTMANLFANYNITNELSAKINLGSDRQQSRRDIYNSTLTVRGAPLGGVADVRSFNRNSYLAEYTMTYNKQLNADHDLTLLGGVTYQRFSTNLLGGTISGFPTDDIASNNLGLGDTNTDNLTSNLEENTLLSYLGRINYNLYDRFLFTGSIRADGSSRFGANNKYGYFPSFAFGWKMSEESFVPDAFEELKLRASWGQTGNQEIGNYASQLTFGSGPSAVYNGAIVGSTIPQRIANPDLKWETTEQFNIGIDASVGNGRYSGTIDYFIKKTSDLLFNLPLPIASGYNSILSNVGEVENKGIEILINSNNVATTDFTWSTSVNFSAIRNKAIDLGRINQIRTGNVQAVGNTVIIQEGEALASYYGYEVTGIFQESDNIAESAQPNSQPGFPIFADLNGDGAITPADQTVIGTPFPDFTYGIQNSLNYKNFSFDFFFQGQQGGNMLSINMIESLYPANFRRNRLSEQALNRWTPQNTDTKWPSGTDPNGYGGDKVNSLVLQDATYFRLKNVRLSYDINTEKINAFSALRIYVTGQNLFTVTDYVGFDPEANSFGRSNVRVDYSSYPLARTFIFGLNASF